MANEELVDASPTKEFFISMITRDIELKPAIIDLLDNSIDGARNLIAAGSEPSDFRISIDLDEDELRIVDNCGGIGLNVARNYAFRFGRPEGMVTIPHSVGQFGIGMKRALFKIGQEFSVDSATATDSFSLSVSVPDWQKRKKWEFTLDEHSSDEDRDVAETYTVITVSNLFRSVANTFGDITFRNQLMAEVAERHQFSLAEGVTISVNGEDLRPRILALAASDEIRPYHSDELVQVAGGSVQVRITAGVSSSSPDDAGWFVFCNDRLILGPDQTKLTGWGVRSPSRIPKYHNQYARFRGFVRFDADDASLLPWNTTKTSLDQDSELWVETRVQMIEVMSSILSHLNDLKVENEVLNRMSGAEDDDFEGQEAGPLREAVDGARYESFTSFAVPQSLEVPEPVIVADSDDSVSIQFRRSRDAVDVLNRYFDTDSARKAGEAAFDVALKFARDDE